MIMSISSCIQKHYMRNYSINFIICNSINNKMSYAGYNTFQELFESGLKKGGSHPDDFIISFGLYRNKTYKSVYDIDRSYIKWLLDQKNIKRDHLFMYNYFEIRMKEHDED